MRAKLTHLIPLLFTAGTVLQSPLLAQDPRKDAFSLASSALKGVRLPDFLTWATRSDLCGNSAPANLPKVQELLRVQASTPIDVKKSDKDTKSANFGSLGLYYDVPAARRLCEPLAPGGPIIAGGKTLAWFSKHGGVMISPPFPVGARSAVAMWMPIERPVNAGTIDIETKIRNKDDSIKPRMIQVFISNEDLRDIANCPQPLPESPPSNATAPPTAHRLNDFYWVQLRKDDQAPTLEKCGDMMILLGFHLVEKKKQGARTMWLWSTFWWDDKPDARFSTANLGSLTGAGKNPAVWKNYAMDAAYGKGAKIFNPWREGNETNCESCHQKAGLPLEKTSTGLVKELPPTKLLSFDMLFAGPVMAQ